MWRSPTEIVLETGQPNEIAFWLSQGVVGVTTNPSIILAVGHYELRVAAHKLATLLDGGPMSVEVASDALGEMVARGRDLAAIAPNLVVRTPIETNKGRPCMDVMQRFASKGVKVNATASMSYGQAMLAAKACATYVSLFGGRISDEGNDPRRAIRIRADRLARWSNPAKSWLTTSARR